MMESWGFEKLRIQWQRLGWRGRGSGYEMRPRLDEVFAQGELAALYIIFSSFWFIIMCILMSHL